MEQWIAIAERFGLPVIMLLGMSWGGIQLFKWLANDLMKQIAENHSRIEGIIIKLIDNSKQEREQNRQNMNEKKYNDIFYLKKTANRRKTGIMLSKK